MSDAFFARPILNSPYGLPGRHWKLNERGLPTGEIVESRRRAEFISPVPVTGRGRLQGGRLFDESAHEDQRHGPYRLINQVRDAVDRWRQLPERQWGVTAETARLLRHWRQHRFVNIRPFFCQLEAAETAIWLVEVARVLRPPGQAVPVRGRAIRDALHDASAGANPDLLRVALKMATGSGKTMVMAMLIAWQTVNAVRHPQRRSFTRGFLVVAPGITIRDRLRVLLPNDPGNYYRTRDLVPLDMLPDLGRAEVVVTNFHAFRRRERMALSKGTRSLLRGRGEALATVETEGEMLRRVLPGLMGLQRVLVLNDEGHHCYRERVGRSDEGKLKGDDLKEAKENTEAARVWISGIETVKRTLAVPVVFDFSATPFFLSGSGYLEGTLFPWTVSDFSLMDAIEAGIVKLPRVPVSDNVSAGEVPKLRNLWAHIGKKMPRRPPGKGKPPLDPGRLPALFETAFKALYSDYERTFDAWKAAGDRRPPVFIVVCSNTAASRLVHDYIAGHETAADDGSVVAKSSPFPLFRNYDEEGRRLPRPRTLLIDSRQLESGEALDPAFRKAAKEEIERFRQEKSKREGAGAAEEVTDAELLREAMNTVGQPDRLGGGIRCVVSVSMLTEGWDANTVTHVLGVRAFSTQLLCEQVVGRALRRQAYELNDDGRFDPEYADVLGVPFDFTAKPTPVPPIPPKPVEIVKALAERHHLEIRFPRVEGYRAQLPDDRVTAAFSADSRFELTPELVGPSLTTNRAIVGLPNDLHPDHGRDVRTATLAFHLARDLLRRHLGGREGRERLHLFGQVKGLTHEWVEGYFECRGGTHRGQLLYDEIAEMACERINSAISAAAVEEGRGILAVTSPYVPEGSSSEVYFPTARKNLHGTTKSHVNFAACDSSWERAFCELVENEPRVEAYVKNAGLGFEVPYLLAGEVHRYLPDFIVRVRLGSGESVHLVVEIKGQPDEATKAKSEAMRSQWIPGVNNLGVYGRWEFVELRSLHSMKEDFVAFLDGLSEGAATVTAANTMPPLFEARPA